MGALLKCLGGNAASLADESRPLRYRHKSAFTPPFGAARAAVQKGADRRFHVRQWKRVRAIPDWQLVHDGRNLTGGWELAKTKFERICVREIIMGCRNYVNK